MAYYWIKKEVEVMWNTLKDGPIEILQGDETKTWVMTSSEAAEYIHNVQSQSIPWACAHEGWRVRNPFSQSILKATRGTLFPFTQIIHVPPHMNKPELIGDLKNWHYPNGIEQGFVSSINKHDVAFCRFWANDDIYKPGLAFPPRLRTLANSEGCDINNLYRFMTFAPGFVQQVYEEATK